VKSFDVAGHRLGVVPARWQSGRLG
jgi:hypothetical protein